MSHFLLVYDRAHGQLLEFQPFTDGPEALRARFRREREFGTRRDIEVVVLGAQSESDLRQTHGRYFHSVSDLLSAALAHDRTY